MSRCVEPERVSNFVCVHICSHAREVASGGRIPRKRIQKHPSLLELGLDRSKNGRFVFVKPFPILAAHITAERVVDHQVLTVRIDVLQRIVPDVRVSVPAMRVKHPLRFAQ